MNERPLITFALFAYNQQEFIEEAVYGALSQTYSPLEIILSDDCSSDQTFEIMERICSEYKGPHKIILNRNNPNLGLVPHVNRVVMDLSHGELIVIAAGDDVSLPERTVTLWNAWERANRMPYGLSSGYFMIDKLGKIIEKIEYSHDEFIGEDMMSCFNSRPVQCVGATFMIHRDIYDLFGGLTEAVGEDTPFLFRSRILGSFLNLKNPLVRYRVGDWNMTYSTGTKETHMRFIAFRKGYYRQLAKDITKAVAYTKLSKSQITQINAICVRRIEEIENEAKLYSNNLIIRIEGKILWRVKALLKRLERLKIARR